MKINGKFFRFVVSTKFIVALGFVCLSVFLFGTISHAQTGTLSRTAICRDNLGNVVADTFCTTPKPSTSSGACSISTPDPVTPSPTPIDGVCDVAPGTCTAGIVALYIPSVIDGTPTTWSCFGSNGGTTASCSVFTPIDGECGPYRLADTKPVSDLCLVGTPSEVTRGGPRLWTCSGVNGGKISDVCQANSAIDPQGLPFDDTNVSSEALVALSQGGLYEIHGATNNYDKYITVDKYLENHPNYGPCHFWSYKIENETWIEEFYSWDEYGNCKNETEGHTPYDSAGNETLWQVTTNRKAFRYPLSFDPMIHYDESYYSHYK